MADRPKRRTAPAAAAASLLLLALSAATTTTTTATAAPSAPPPRPAFAATPRPRHRHRHHHGRVERRRTAETTTTVPLFGRDGGCRFAATADDDREDCGGAAKAEVKVKAAAEALLRNIAGTAAAALILLGPPPVTTTTPTTTIVGGPEAALSLPFADGHRQHVRLFQPRAAFAVVDAADLAASDDADHALDGASLLPAPDAIGTMIAPTDATGLSSPLSALKSKQRSTVLDEVWSLVDKYYLDQTYAGQDWNAVRDKYEDKLDLDRNDDAQTMKLATEMVKSLGDKYSRVLDRESYARIQKFDLIGVGATLMPDSDKRLTVGAPPVSGSAADLAGMKAGDFVTAVNGVPTEGRTAFDIIDQIGEDPNAGTVTMTVRTVGPDDLANEGYVRDLTLKREFREIKDPVSYRIAERRSDGTVVGYVRASEFNSLVKPRLEEAIRDLESRGANALVLDVRGNPGGAFQSAVEIAGLFVDDALATSVVDGNGVELPFRTSKGRVVADKSHPMAVWVDGRSASASEVLGGALRDNCRAVVMGDRSFGKGLIQAVYGLKNGGGLVLTVARYMTPAGTDIQGSGISPDIGGPKSPVPFVMSTDTSKVDFGDIKKRMSPPMCQAPMS